MNRIHTLQADKGPIYFQWQRQFGAYLAVGGRMTHSCKGNVSIYDKLGNMLENVTLVGEVTGLEWTEDGEVLAVISAKSSTVYLWDAARRCAMPPVETSFHKGLCLLRWSVDSKILAVGMNKGNLVLYNRVAGGVIPVLGKHSKAIVSAAWDAQGQLTLGSEDNTFSITDAKGNGLSQLDIRGVPLQLRWAQMQVATDAGAVSLRPVLSMTVSGKTLLFHDPAHPEQPVELSFQPKYGNIVQYAYGLEGDQVLLGFSAGFLVCISTKLTEIGQEKLKIRNYKDTLTDIAVCHVCQQVATAGDGSIKIHDLSDIKEVYAILEVDEHRGNLDRLAWSPDGQFLSVSTRDGALLTFLCKIPDLTGMWGSRVAYTASLHQVRIADQAQLPSAERGAVSPDVRTMQVTEEPTALALGPSMLVTAASNTCHFYPLAHLDAGPAWSMEFTSMVLAVAVSATCAAVLLTEGKVQVSALFKHDVLQPTGHPFSDDRTYYTHMDGMAWRSPSAGLELSHSLKLPPDELATTATCMALTADFLVVGTASGLILHYDLATLTQVNEVRHNRSIKAVFPQPDGGVKFVFVDEDCVGFLASPVSKAIMIVPEWPAAGERVLWETCQPPGRNLFAAYNGSTICSYAYDACTIQGSQCIPLGTTRRPFGVQPALLRQGVLSCQTASGKLELIRLGTHASVVDADEFLTQHATEEAQSTALQLLYMCGRNKELWELRKHVASRTTWTSLAELALHRLDLAFARRVYGHVLQDAGTVLYLERVQQAEDQPELCGHVCVLLREFDLAQDFFLRSGNPRAALELRRDLLQWEEALQLAHKLYPELEPVLAREFAQQLEFKERYGEALSFYEKALSMHLVAEYLDMGVHEHRKLSIYGLIRNSLRQGDLLRGMSMLKEIEDPVLLTECGAILVGMKQYQDAATLFQAAEQWERAADCLIRIKNWTALGSILGRIKSPRVHVQYAKAKEAEGDFVEAANAYERGKDYDNLVRVQVELLRNIDAAVSVVRLTRSPQSARLVAQYFQSVGEYLAVIEFMVMAGMLNEAFDVAQLHDQMEFFAELVRRDASKEMLLNIVSYFKHRNKPFAAAKYLYYAEEYAKALNVFLSCPFQEEIVEFAIDTVGKAREDPLTHTLIDYLMGETDGIPKDAKYIFRLYMSLGQYKEAGRTAIIIGREEQNLGNYRAARDLMFDSYRQLIGSGNKVPTEIDRMLMLLHSYTIVKTLVKLEEHEMAARMLVRVSKHISRFPSHMVPILTSTVIECHKAGLKKSAFDYAALLMRPEYRPQLDEKYARKIEQIIRRPEQGEKTEECSPCPYCQYPLVHSLLDCPECKNRVPYCIVTGQHMVLDNWSCCPSCRFPALYTHFKAQLTRAPQCPMCYVKLEEREVVQITDPRNLLADNAERLEAEQAEAGARGPEAPPTTPQQVGEGPGKQDDPRQVPPTPAGGEIVFNPSYVDGNGGRTRSRDNLADEPSRKFERQPDSGEDEGDAF